MFIQSLKMACKSLWTNKVRSFLTMLGIIIGVVAVSLLITVTQGVSSAIVSSIRSKSTLSFMTNLSSLSNKDARKIISNVQPKDSNASDYFDYSLTSYKASLIANDSLDGFDGDYISDFLTADRIYTLDDFPNYDSMSAEEQSMIKLLLMKKKGALNTNVYAVDENFSKVYGLVIDGRYFSGSDEVVVDENFIDTFLGKDVSNEEALNRTITLGVTNYTNIKLVYNESLSEAKIKKIIEIVSSEYDIQTGNDAEGNPIYTTSKLDIIANDDGTIYTYTESTNEEGAVTSELSINIEIIRYLTNAELKEKFLEISAKPQIAFLFKNSEIFVKDIYKKDKAKEYKIVGVLNKSSNSILTDILSSGSDNNSSIISSYINSMTSSRGNCYVLLDDENVSCLYQKDISVDDATLSFAYFRYKSEDVMSSSTANLVVAFSSAGYSFLSDFVLLSFSTIANVVSSIMNILTTLLSVVSIISLVVGGIGIMNIMIVSVSERTREIGIRKAIGAKKSSILVQFLIEAFLISLLGCIGGLAISFISVIIISNIMNISIVMPFNVVFISIGFCSAIGLIFGMVPAIKASNMQPIDALRRD